MSSREVVQICIKYFRSRHINVKGDDRCGAQMGLKVDPNAEFGEEKTTFNFTPKVDPEMKRFGQIMKGTEKE